MGRQKIQHPNIFRSASTLRGQLTRVKDQDPLEKKSGVVYQIPCSCGHVDEESPRDPHKGAQSCHQTGRDREVGHSRARLGTTTPNTVGGDQRVGSSKEQHHIAHQRGSTHPPHQSRTDQQRRGRRHSGMLTTGPGSWTMPR